MVLTLCYRFKLSVDSRYRNFSELSFMYSFERDRVREIQWAVLNGTYSLSTFKLEVFPQDHPKTGFYCTFSVPDLPDAFLVVRAEEENSLF